MKRPLIYIMYACMHVSYFYSMQSPEKDGDVVSGAPIVGVIKASGATFSRDTRTIRSTYRPELDDFEYYEEGGIRQYGYPGTPYTV